MNCIICINNYFITEDTKSCYEKVIDNYYLDNVTNILRRCHHNCKSCYSKPINYTFMNCITCPNNYYLTEDTDSCYDKVIDNYYLDNTTYILRRCHPNCKSCYSQPINDTYMNCISCPNNYYLTEDTDACYNEVIDNYFFDFNTKKLRRCHPNCLRCSSKPINNTFMNCLTCYHNYFITEDTKSCYNIIINNYYLDVNTLTLRRCHPNCFLCSNAPKSDKFMNCLTCKKNYYMTEDTNSCYKRAIDNYYFDTNMYKKCHQNCLYCYNITDKETFINCLECYNFYVTEDKNTCYNYIKNNIYNFYNLSNNDKEENIYYEIPMDDHFIKLTTSTFMVKNFNTNKTTINLNKCESLLKKAYNIPENISLYIMILDVEEEGMKIPKVEYEVFKLNEENNLEKLNLSYCKGENVEVSIPVTINGSIDLYNSSSGYYNDICYLTTSKYNTDICLKDRRQEFIDNNLTLCEENCFLKDYDYINKKAKCSCKIKLNLIKRN